MEAKRPQVLGRLAAFAAFWAVVVLLVACVPSVNPSVSTEPSPSLSAPADPTAPTVLAAADIASCDSDGDEATAALLDEHDGTILALGDLAYEDGSSREFGHCYDPTWGRHKDRTRPAVGNHEYHTAGAEDYFDYFGSAAGTPGEGWYSFDLGDWHLVALNSNCDRVACDPDSPQLAWLTDDLATRAAECTLAFMHHPRWSSGDEHGPIDMTDALWRTLQRAGVDLLLGGHDHTYERFGPMDADGAASPDGMVQFVVGTGGRSLYRFDTLLPASAAHDASTFGVLQLTLGEGTYDWAFIPVAGGSFTDTGTASCR